MPQRQPTACSWSVALFDDQKSNILVSRSIIPSHIRRTCIKCTSYTYCSYTILCSFAILLDKAGMTVVHIKLAICKDVVAQAKNYYPGCVYHRSKSFLLLFPKLPDTTTALNWRFTDRPYLLYDLYYCMKWIWAQMTHATLSCRSDFFLLFSLISWLSTSQRHQDFCSWQQTYHCLEFGWWRQDDLTSWHGGSPKKIIQWEPDMQK